MPQLPRYFCPPGIALPAHAPFAPTAHLAILPGKGPDADAAATADGKLYGGTYETGEPGWWRAEAGWWANLSGVMPHHLARLDTSPRIARWQKVQGARFDHWWRLPVLVAPTEGENSADQETIYASALDRIWRGGDQWVDPEDLATLQRRVLNVAYGIALSRDLTVERATLAEVAVEVLALGAHVSQEEIKHEGWLSDSFLLRIYIACTDTPIPEVA